MLSTREITFLASLSKEDTPTDTERSLASISYFKTRNILDSPTVYFQNFVQLQGSFQFAISHLLVAQEVYHTFQISNNTFQLLS